MSRLTIEEAIEQFKDLEGFVMNETGALPNDKDMEAFEVLIEAVQELQHYKDLEEQGLLLKLPCKVGDTGWQITRNFISEFKIKSFVCDNEGIFFYWECISGIYINILGFSNNRIGKDVFLTKEEAEAKLAELKGTEE